MRYENVTIGGDFEYFLTDHKGNPFPSCGLIGGTKEQPREMGEPGYLITEDNVMVEYNIPPTTTVNDFAEAVVHGFDLTTRFLPPSLVPNIKATMEFDPDILQKIPQAMQFGCMPDYNAWTVTRNPRPDSNVNFRSAAGHIHIGWKNPDEDKVGDGRIDLIRAADVFASLPSVWEDPDRQRRSLYGKAGACRFKEYGVEHRVLGNYWIESKKTARTIFNRYQQAIDFLNAGNTIEEADFQLIQDAINNYDVELAKKLHSKYDKMVPMKYDVPAVLIKYVDKNYNKESSLKQHSMFTKANRVFDNQSHGDYEFSVVWTESRFEIIPESVRAFV